MTFSLSLEDIQAFVSDFSNDQWVSSSSLDITQCVKPPIGVSLECFLSPEHPFLGLFSSVDDFVSLSEDITMRFQWIWIEGKTNRMSSVLEMLESKGYELKIWRETPHLTKLPEQCGALLYKEHKQESTDSFVFVNHTKGNVDPIKLKRLFESDPFTRAEQWHTQDLFKKEKERQLLLESQKPKRHDPLGIFESDEAPVVVKMSNPFAPSSITRQNTDPLGIFSSNEAPIVVKMSNPFLKT